MSVKCKRQHADERKHRRPSRQMTGLVLLGYLPLFAAKAARPRSSKSFARAVAIALQ